VFLRRIRSPAPYDFNEDSLLIVRTGNKFYSRIAKSLRKKLGNKFTIRDSSVAYLDPYLETRFSTSDNGSHSDLEGEALQIPIPRNEYRIVGLPQSISNETENLGDPIFEIGNISDIAELHEIDWKASNGRTERTNPC